MSAQLWAAVDRLTLSTRIPVERATDADWLIDVAVEQAEIAAGRRDGACSVPAYRAALAREQAANVATATVPALWDQAVQALGLGSENAGGGGSTAPLRERSPADLNLMEILSQVREAVREESARLGHPLPGGQTVGTVQIRAFASTLRTDLDGWGQKFALWGRAIENYLHVLRDEPRPFRLRSTPCPLCRIEWIRVNEQGRATVGGEYLARPIKVDFAGDRMRAAICEACGTAWFRGADLHQLAALIGCETPDTAAEAS